MGNVPSGELTVQRIKQGSMQTDSPSLSPNQRESNQMSRGPHLQYGTVRNDSYGLPHKASHLNGNRSNGNNVLGKRSFLDSGLSIDDEAVTGSVKSKKLSIDDPFRDSPFLTRFSAKNGANDPPTAIRSASRDLDSRSRSGTGVASRSDPVIHVKSSPEHIYSTRSPWIFQPGARLHRSKSGELYDPSAEDFVIPSTDYGTQPSQQENPLPVAARALPNLPTLPDIKTHTTHSQEGSGFEHFRMGLIRQNVNDGNNNESSGPFPGAHHPAPKRPVSPSQATRSLVSPGFSPGTIQARGGIINRISPDNRVNDTASETSSTAYMKSKICHICRKPQIGDFDPMVQCISCRRRYHAKCPNPPIEQRACGKNWKCNRCVKQSRQSLYDTGRQTPVLTTGSADDSPLHREVSSDVPPTFEHFFTKRHPGVARNMLRMRDASNDPSIRANVGNVAQQSNFSALSNGNPSRDQDSSVQASSSGPRPRLSIGSVEQLVYYNPNIEKGNSAKNAINNSLNPTGVSEARTHSVRGMDSHRSNFRKASYIERHPKILTNLQIPNSSAVGSKGWGLQNQSLPIDPLAAVDTSGPPQSSDAVKISDTVHGIQGTETKLPTKELTITLSRSSSPKILGNPRVIPSSRETTGDNFSTPSSSLAITHNPIDSTRSQDVKHRPVQGQLNSHVTSQYLRDGKVVPYNTTCETCKAKSDSPCCDHSTPVPRSNSIATDHVEGAVGRDQDRSPVNVNIDQADKRRKVLEPISGPFIARSGRLSGSQTPKKSKFQLPEFGDAETVRREIIQHHPIEPSLDPILNTEHTDNKMEGMRSGLGSLIEEVPKSDNGVHQSLDSSRVQIASHKGPQWTLPFPTTKSEHFLSHNPTFDRDEKLAEIKARPSKKATFGQRLAFARTHRQNVHREVSRPPYVPHRFYVPVQKDRTEVEDERLGKDQDSKRPKTWEELLGMPNDPIPCLHEGELAYREGAPRANGRPPNRNIYRVGPSFNR